MLCTEIIILRKSQLLNFSEADIIWHSFSCSNILAIDEFSESLLKIYIELEKVKIKSIRVTWRKRFTPCVERRIKQQFLFHILTSFCYSTHGLGHAYLNSLLTLLSVSFNTCAIDVKSS